MNWTRKAAEQGSAEAEFALGLMYANGQGVKKNNAEAVNWYRKSAEQGLPEGQNALGFMLEKGRGVPKNPTDALNWYHKAADQGWAAAQYHLGLLYYKGPRAMRDQVEAYKWFVILTTVHGDVDFVRERIMENMRSPFQNEAAAAMGFMTTAQVQQAEDAAKAWLDQHRH